MHPMDDFIAIPGLQCAFATVSGASGHAHPQAAVALDETRNITEVLAELISKVPMSISLRKITGDASPCGPVMPRVRRSSITNEPVQHLDIVSCWKGLSHQQALEIDKWEQAFEQCIASQMKQSMRRNLVELLEARYADPTNESLLVYRLIEIILKTQSNEMVLSMPKLVHDMINSLYRRWPSDATGRHLAWSLSSGNLPNFVFNFVGTHDCVFYGPEDPATPRVSFKVSPSYREGILTLSVEPKWYLVSTTFPSLPVRLSYGEMYRIAPQINYACLGDDAQGFSSYTHNVEYSLPNSTLLMQWDFNNGCFHAPVTHNSQLEHNSTIQTLLCTKITTPFHDGVRFERMSRYHLKLEVNDAVLPSQRHRRNSSMQISSWEEENLVHTLRHHFDTSAKSNDIEDLYANAPYLESMMGSSCGRPRIRHQTRDGTRIIRAFASDRPVDFEVSGRVQPIHHESSYPELGYAADKVQAISPSKRKASVPIISSPTDSDSSLAKFDHHDLDKRRKVGQDCNDSASAMWDAPETAHGKERVVSSASDILYAHIGNMMTSPVVQVQNSGATMEVTWFGKVDSHKDSVPPGSRAATIAGPSQTTSPWYIHADSSPVDSAAPSSPANYALEPPTQHEIQRNYIEFLELKKRREADRAYYTATIPGFDGVVSPTDEGDEAFERAFLEGDSEGEDGDGDEEGEFGVWG